MRVVYARVCHARGRSKRQPAIGNTQHTRVRGESRWMARDAINAHSACGSSSMYKSQAPEVGVAQREQKQCEGTCSRGRQARRTRSAARACKTSPKTKWQKRRLT
jgi:hypothetical protein